MGFKLSSLFFVEEEEKKEIIKEKTENLKEKENIKKVETPAEKKEIINNVNNNREGNIDEEIVNKAKENLIKSIENANLDGYDYLEFKTSLKALENVIQDEQMRFKTAFAAVSPMGVTLEKLVSTAQNYIEVLKNEEKKFLFALGTKSDTDISGSEKKILEIDENIKKKEEMIEEIKKEIEKLKENKNLIAKSIEESKQKIENSKNSFYKAYKEVLENLEKDIEKIKEYIK